MKLELWLEDSEIRGKKKHTIGEGTLKIDHANTFAEWLPASGRRNRKLKLHPGNYYRLELSCEHNEQPLEWHPDEERDDLLILQCQRPKEGPFINWTFQVDNDGVLPKLIRWRFSHQHDGNLIFIWRLPLHVQPRRSQQVAMMFSFAIGLLVADSYERLVDFWLQGNNTWAGWCAASTMLALGIVIVGFVLWQALVWFWNWNE